MAEEKVVSLCERMVFKHPVFLFLAERWPLLLQLREFERLVEDALTIPDSFNDVLAKHILSHNYGERMAIIFRDWVRSRMDPTEELECGGASFDSHQRGEKEEAA